MLLSKEGKVSIIIPTHNVEAYVRKGVSSALGQTYRNIEVVVVDDGSSDATWDILQEYRDDERLVLAHQTNSGVSRARNHALDLASGDYVLFLDSDDWLEPDACEQLIRMQRIRPDALAAVGAYFVSIEDGSEVFSDQTAGMVTMDFTSDEAIMKFGVFNSIHVASSCYKLFSMDVIEANELRFNESVSHTEDGLFVFHYLKVCHGLHYEPLPLWNILERPGSATTCGYNSGLLSSLVAIDEMREHPGNKPEVVEHLSVFKVHEALRILEVGIDSGGMTHEERERLVHAVGSDNVRISQLSEIDRIRRVIYPHVPRLVSKVFIFVLGIMKRAKSRC